MKKLRISLFILLSILIVGCSSKSAYEIVENNNMYECLSNGDFLPANEEDISEFNMSIEALLEKDFSFSNTGLNYWIEDLPTEKNILFIFSLLEDDYEFVSYNALREIPVVLKELGMDQEYANLKIAICKSDGVIRNSFSFKLKE